MESVKQNSGVVKWIAAGAFAALLVAGGLLVQRVSQLEAALDGQREASEKQLEAIKETAASSASAMGVRSTARVGPVSSPASIFMIVTPVSGSPLAMAHWMGAAPR